MYKRQTREVSQEVRAKISASLKGRTVTPETRKKISDGQKRAWARIPKKTQTFEVLWGNDNNEDTTSNNGSKKAN